MLKRRKKSNQEIEEKKTHFKKRNEFFLSIWKERPHICMSCNIKLWGEINSLYFDHLLEKAQYKELEFEKDNIALVCGDCHAKKTNGFPTEAHKKLIENAKKQFKINQ